MNKEIQLKNKYALITGASAGIGRAFAEELARRGVNLVLVALPGSGLEEFSGQLAATHSVKVKCLCIDLTLPEGPPKVKEFTDLHALRIDILINNAGIGYNGDLEKHSPQSIDEMILLNIRALTLLNRYYIGDLKQADKGIIFNLGSFGSFVPSPFKSVYIASKAYVFYFSEALRLELDGTGIKVLTLMPGPIMTNEIVKARINKAGFAGKATALYPEELVKYALKNINCRSGIILPGIGVKTTYYLLGLLPYLLVTRILKKVFHSNAH